MARSYSAMYISHQFVLVFFFPNFEIYCDNVLMVGQQTRSSILPYTLTLPMEAQFIAVYLRSWRGILLVVRLLFYR